MSASADVRRRRLLVLLGVAWTAAMLIVGAWAARVGLFGWSRAAPLHVVDVRSDGARLPEATRARLRPRMARHADEMMALTRATMLLDKQAAATHAAAVLDDPQLARPMTSEAAALQLELPPAFHAYEDELEHETRAILTAAQAGDDDAMVAAQSRMAYTCARCHLAFTK